MKISIKLFFLPICCVYREDAKETWMNVSCTCLACLRVSLVFSACLPVWLPSPPSCLPACLSECVASEQTIDFCWLRTLMQFLFFTQFDIIVISNRMWVSSSHLCWQVGLALIIPGLSSSKPNILINSETSNMESQAQSILNKCSNVGNIVISLFFNFLLWGVMCVGDVRLTIWEEGKFPNSSENDSLRPNCPQTGMQSSAENKAGLNETKNRTEIFNVP